MYNINSFILVLYTIKNKILFYLGNNMKFKALLNTTFSTVKMLSILNKPQKKKSPLFFLST